MLIQLQAPDVQTLARVKAVEPAVSAIAQRDQLGVSNRRYEGALRVCGAAGDWPAVNRLSQQLKVRSKRADPAASKFTQSSFKSKPDSKPAGAPWTGVLLTSRHSSCRCGCDPHSPALSAVRMQCRRQHPH